MSQQTTINIAPEKIYGKCDLKCAYDFKYTNTNLTATNMGVLIKLTCDNANVPPVTYNNLPYNVSTISIVAPSLHIFNGSQKPAEIIIQHTPKNGGDLLYVCIPITQSSDSSTATTLLSQVISSTAANAPAENETTNINISNFNLNDIVPKKPFYSYVGTGNYSGDIIVFGNQFSIPLNDSTLKSLSSIIKPWPISMTTNGNLFLNRSGPNVSGAKDGGIYISCQPTGSSEETMDVTNSLNSNNSIDGNVSFDFNVLIPYIMYIIIALVFVLLFWVVGVFFNGKANTPSSGGSFLKDL